MIEIILFVFGILVGAVIEYFFPFMDKFLDFVQDARPQPKTVHDVEIIKPKW